MTLVTILFEAILFCWFFGCICTYKFKNYILVEGVGIKSAEFIMLCLFVIGVISFWIQPFWGKWFLLGVLVFWFAVQFFCHWYYTFFGASEKKLKGYNDCFKNTVHIIPASETKLIPDLYHIILHLLILTNIGLIIYNIAI
ncbi:MAG: hypothetical protein PUE85_06860 [Firmicutes bacterium]|nr:hypothetical protein [Bacillota bacterium]